MNIPHSGLHGAPVCAVNQCQCMVTSVLVWEHIIGVGYSNIGMGTMILVWKQ